MVLDPYVSMLPVQQTVTVIPCSILVFLLLYDSCCGRVNVLRVW
jgi:hypothetical protein